MCLPLKLKNFIYDPNTDLSSISLILKILDHLLSNSMFHTKRNTYFYIISNLIFLNNL